MAGIGFVLRKLVRQDNLTSIFSGYLFSALITTGPWLFTILALGGIGLFGEKFSTLQEMAVFRLVIIYNFSFSLVLAGPLTMVVTRYISDKIYLKDVREVPGTLFGSLGILYAVQVPLVFFFYLGYVDLRDEIALAAIVNYFLISGIWMVSVFLSALKDYGTISATFAVGMVTAFLGAIYLAQGHPHEGILWGFNIGLGIILFSLIARIMAEYPYRNNGIFGFVSSIKQYWDLALCGFCYNLGIWVDKWIMWFSPAAQELKVGFISYPHYDTAMFLAYLTIIPSMAIFFLNIETNFYEVYRRFFQDIQGHATFEKITKNQKAITRNLLESSRNLIFFQGIISFLAIFLAPELFEVFNINYLLLGMFRIGVLGSFFQVLSMFMLIILFYFDFRKIALTLVLLMLGTNGLFTYVGMNMGFAYYGYGYFIASILTFAFTYCITFYYIDKLPYRAFVKNNSSIQ